MKFFRVNQIEIAVAGGGKLQSIKVSGYRSGPFTIHRASEADPWVLSIRGGRFLETSALERATLAAEELFKQPLKWHGTLHEINTEILDKPEIRSAVMAIREKYT